MPESTEEKLVLVERFEELRAGMLVVVKPCNAGQRFPHPCTGQHRAMLLRAVAADDPMWEPSEAEHAFTFAPDPWTGPRRFATPPTIGQGAVRTGRVWRVVVEIPPADVGEVARQERHQEGERIARVLRNMEPTE